MKKNDVILQVEVTTRCNHDCLYCPRYLIPKTRTLGDISPEMAELLTRRLSEAREDYAMTVSFSGFGEPTLHPHLMKMVCDVKRATDANIRLNTNAVYLDELSDQIISCGCVDNLTLSLNLPTRELYLKYTQRDHFEKVKDNIIRFLQKKQDRKPSSDIRLISMPETMPYLDEARTMLGGYLNKNDEFSVAQLSNWGGYIGEKKTQRAEPCRFLGEEAGKHLSIDKDGYTSICCFSIAFGTTHPLTIGNIADHSITELLSLAKQRARNLRGTPICSGCNAKEVEGDERSL